MRIIGSVSTIARVAALLAVLAAGACTHAGGKLMVDAPKLLPYQAPDADEIAGIDPDDEDDKPAEAPAQNQQK